MTREFRHVLRGAIKGEIIIPRLRALLTNPSFDGFEVPIAKWEHREPDYWFHPSTHPLWEPRMLYYYMTEPSKLVVSEFETPGTMAVTQGTFWHSFIQAIMLEGKLLLNVNPSGRFPHDKTEFPVVDEELRSRGHMDGVLNPEAMSIPDPLGFELKTTYTSRLYRVPKVPPTSSEKTEWLKSTFPGYYAQAQEYLRISGLQRQVFLFIGTESPFPLAEISVPFSYSDAMAVAEKYRSVLQAVADGVPPDPCCMIGSTTAKSCVARTVCPIGVRSTS